MNTSHAFSRLAASSIAAAATFVLSPAFAAPPAPAAAPVTYTLLAREADLAPSAVGYTVQGLRSSAACLKTTENIALNRARTAHATHLRTVKSFCQDSDGNMIETYSCSPTKTAPNCTVAHP